MKSTLRFQLLNMDVSMNPMLWLHNYVGWAKKLHRGLEVKECGLFVDETHVYMAASPDRLVSCVCCGSGLLEVTFEIETTKS